MPNFIKHMHFVFLSVKLETVRLLLKISFKNLPSSAHKLNDEWCNTTLCAYCIFALVALFFKPNMLLVKIEDWTSEDDQISFPPDALVVEDAGDLGVLWKKSVFFITFNFLVAASYLCVLPLACFLKASSTPFETLTSVLHIRQCPWCGYFTLKVLFVLKIFIFLSWLFGHIEKWLD